MKPVDFLPALLLVAACHERPTLPDRPLPTRTGASAIVLPDERPVWDVYPQGLECRGSTYMQCFHPRGSCVTDDSEAHLIVDFAASSVSWIGSNREEVIVGRVFESGGFVGNVHIEPQSAIYLSDPSNAIDFGGRTIDEEEPNNPGTLAATMTHTDGYETFIHRMRCTPR